MDISSTNVSANVDASTKQDVGTESLKKSMEVQERAVSQVIEGMDEQNKDMQKINAQKTGIGNSVNILG